MKNPMTKDKMREMMKIKTKMIKNKYKLEVKNSYLD